MAWFQKAGPPRRRVLLIAAPLALMLAAPATASAAPQASTTAARTAAAVEAASTASVELVVESRSSLNEGQVFGDVGPYERLRGYALGELDPADPANAAIVNLDKAPRNADGNVEYRVDVEIHVPVDVSKGNGTLLYDVVNRGGPRVQSYLNPDSPLSYEQGFTHVWSGWQGDISRAGDNLIASFPIATNDGAPIVGLSRDEFVDQGTETWTGGLTYPAANLDPSEATLTVRENERDPRVPVTSWRYLNEREIEVTPPGAPYSSGAIFEFIYPAKDPIVAGIGFAATRDVNSFLRYELADSAGNQNPVGPDAVSNAIAMGVSQSGRFLRDFVYQGFNEDLQGRQVFDGVMPIIPGSRKTWVNYEFAQPGRWSKQHEEHLQRGDQFPFAYTTIEDPLTGEVDGILARCEATGTCPKVMHVDGEFEVWGARGSLLVTDGDPAMPQDLPLPADVRLYMVAGTPHGGANRLVPEDPTQTGICQQVNTPLGSGAVIRALLLALNAWVTEGTPPPESRYGSADEGTLVRSDRESTGFPDIPGVTYNGLYNYLHVTDYTTQPPTEGAEYGILVPKVDEDGNSLAGIRLPALEAPVATYTGWNLRAAGHAEGEMCLSRGSYIPFPRTAAERQETGDPRESIEERYESHADYVQQFTAAAQQLAQQGYLLQQDVDAMVAQAEALTGAGQPFGPVPQPRAIDDSCTDGVPEDGFTDVPDSSPFEGAVDCLRHWQITRGTSATTYAPRALVSREQMAAFVARTITASGGTLPDGGQDRFGDDDTSNFESDINRLAAAGIVNGTGVGTYSPKALVTRAQMAAFLVRAHDYRASQEGGEPLTSDQDFFADDDWSTLEDDINAAAEAGIAVGHTDGTYRPSEGVRRDHMAAFLTRELDLLVENGLAEVP